MKINLDLRHRISVVEAQGKAVIQQKAELEAMSQARQQELGALRQEVARLKEERKEWELDMKMSAEEEPSTSKAVMTVLTPVSAKVTTATTPYLIKSITFLFKTPLHICTLYLIELRRLYPNYRVLSSILTRTQ